MDRWRTYGVLRLALVLLFGGFSLIAASLAGVGASPWLVAWFLGFALLLRGVRPMLAGTVIDRIDTPDYHADLWIGAVVAAVVTAVFLGATPGEVQALGGLVGLAGMMNYFLRPVYHITYAAGRRIVGVAQRV
jgi:hypothetical protein